MRRHLTVAACVRGASRNIATLSLARVQEAHRFRPAKQRAQLYRRWPKPKPSCEAFTRNAATVRFISLETLATGVLSFECFLRLRRSAAVHSRRVCFLLLERFNSLAPKFVTAVLAIALCVLNLQVRNADSPVRASDIGSMHGGPEWSRVVRRGGAARQPRRWCNN